MHGKPKGPENLDTRLNQHLFYLIRRQVSWMRTYVVVVRAELCPSWKPVFHSFETAPCFLSDV